MLEGDHQGRSWGTEGWVQGRSKNTTIPVDLAHSKESWHEKWRNKCLKSNKSEFPAQNVFLTLRRVQLSSRPVHWMQVQMLLHCPTIPRKETAPSEVSYCPALTKGWAAGSQSSLEQAGDVYRYTEQWIPWLTELKILKKKFILC